MSNKLSVLILVVFIALTVVLTNSVLAGEKDISGLVNKLKTEIEKNSNASNIVKIIALVELLPLSTNPIIVDEVKNQNSKSVSLEEIKKVNSEWLKSDNQLPVHSQVLNNRCSRELRHVININDFIVEAYVMDNQGAMVAGNVTTREYWQGEGVKWKTSYNNGTGGIYIEEEKFDNTAGMNLQHISLPVIDENGSVIGALAFGIAIQKL